jgi:hypothetical protein
MSVRVLYEDEYSSVTYDASQRMIVYRRNAKAYPTLEAASTSIGSSWKTLPTLGTLSHHTFLMDIREAPMNASEGFDQVARDVGPQLTGRFRRAAVLVRTAVGKLQMNRIRRERQTDLVVFDDESAAMAYLRAGE